MKNRITGKFIFCSLLFFLPKAHSAEWLDKSSAIFFPTELKTQITASQTFPVFWWNFIVVDGKKEFPNWTRARELCQTLKTIPQSELAQVQCETGPDQFLPLLEAWAKDLIFRTPALSFSESKEHLNRTLSEASLPMSNPGLMNVFRHDPFETWKDLKARAEKRMPIHLGLVQGFLFDQPSGRILIPIQFAFPPSESSRTQTILEKLAHPILIGPHGSTLTNETQIKTDMHSVGVAGFLVLAIFAVLLYRLKMARLVPLFGVVFIGTGMSAIVTKLVFGSIHGLTLSFGAAIAGLAMDYAFQAALNPQSDSIWKSNFCGFCTTSVGLVVVMFSSVPLLRQMMFFSLLGIGISYGLFYFLFHLPQFSSRFTVTPSNYVPAQKKFQLPLSAILVLIALIGLFSIRPILDLRQFDYQSQSQKELSKWLYETTQLKTPIFEIHSENEMNLLDQEKTFSESQHLALENRAEYLPNDQASKENQISWSAAWPGLIQGLSPTEKKFFSPFFDSVHPGEETTPRAPSYLFHLTSPLHPGSEWITLWLPASESEAQTIRERFPQTRSLLEIVSTFPKLLSHELRLMVPISILLALLFHLIYYRRLSYAAIALIPFFTGLGLIVSASLLFHFSLSFISVIALILVFGFSLDYGIFATDACIRSSEKGMWMGISLAALSTIAGFLPLVFCKHPVLKDLGLTLFFGGIGTYLGAIWAIPHAVNLVMKRGKS